jgi:hypothetical protein
MVALVVQEVVRGLLEVRVQQVQVVLVIQAIVDQQETQEPLEEEVVVLVVALETLLVTIMA